MWCLALIFENSKRVLQQRGDRGKWEMRKTTEC